MSTPTQTPARQTPATGPQANGAPAPAAPAAEKGKPGRKPGSTVKLPDTSTIDLAMISQPLAVPETIGKRAAPARARNDQQKAMDATVRKLHAAWVKAGKPSAWGALLESNVVGMYSLAPEQVEAVKLLIRRAVDFNGIRVRWGQPVAERIDGKATGKELVIFAIMDKRERSDGDDTDAETPKADVKK